ncbi:MAG: hypothetical protein ACHQ0J_03460 [Candidatus Dormibacterales bacterium]
MTEPHPSGPSRSRYDAGGIETIRLQWGPFCHSLTGVTAQADAAVQQAVDYLQAGLPADAVAALLRVRLGSQDPALRARIGLEQAYCDNVRRDLADMVARGLVSTAETAAVDRDFQARLDALATWQKPIAASIPAAPGAAAPAAAGPPAAAIAPPPAAPKAPSVRGPSLRDLFAEHSVVILASLGAFLLVVATVLFELYGTVGLGGEVRLGAVVALNLILAVAGYMASRQDRLRAVGRIYTGLAAALLPLVGIAAWTFLALGSRGVTVDQALAATAIACAIAYGFLGRQLDLRAYGEMSGLALLVAAWGLSGALAGDHWRSAGLGLAPLAFTVWTRAVPDRVFSNFAWYGAAGALAGVGAALRFNQSGWEWTATLAAVAAAYLASQAVVPNNYRGWIGEAALVLAATAANGPLGLGSYHFVLPMLVAAPLIALDRATKFLGPLGRLYRPHPALLQLAVIAGVLLAAGQGSGGDLSPAAVALWFAVGIYLVDFALGRSELTGYTLRASLPLALALTGEAWSLGSWTATLVAASLAAYCLPFAFGSALKALTTNATPFFYGAVLLVGFELRDASIGAGRWQITVALAVASAGLGAGAEIGSVDYGAYVARATLAIAWFCGVDALDAQGWRGPFDALLALLYVAASRLRSLAAHSIATAGRRWFVHAAAVGALILCFTGPDDLLWWRLASASGALAAGYWWLSATTAEIEMPWLAWAASASTLGSLALAWVPEPWQGTAIAGAALALTAGWGGARRILKRPQVEASALPVLVVMVVAGLALTLRQDLPQWSQTAALILAGAFLVAWSRLAKLPVLVHSLRSAGAAFTSAGLLLGVATPHLNEGVAGLLAVGIAAGHAEWSVRARSGIERWYAVAALLVVAPVVYFWPYGQTPAGLIAAEFAILAVICVEAGVRRRQWFLAYPAALLTAPALHLLFIALGLGADGAIEVRSFAVLAFALGLSGLVLRTRYWRGWALSVEAGAVTIAIGTLAAMSNRSDPDAAGVALLAYGVVIYAAGMQERQRWVLPAAAATALSGATTLLYSRGADTILYAAALGALGLVIWAAGRVAFMRQRRNAVVDMHRYLGLGLLTAAAIAGFAFPDRTGPSSRGAVLAAAALLVDGAVLWLDSRDFGFRPNHYLALVSAAAAGYFVARDLRLESWELVPPGLGMIASGVLMRGDTVLPVDSRIRRGIVVAGLALVMGWAAAHTVTGDLPWLVALLVEGSLTVGASIVLRSRVLLAGGGAALALVSLRALLTVAQAGYLFAAFGAVALVLLAAATALALSRDRTLAGARGMRAQLAEWD